MQDRKGNKHLLQVTWEMNHQDTIKRETKALEKAKKELGFSGNIVTLESYLRDVVL